MLLGEQMSVREFARRELIFNKGASADALYFLIEGRLQAVDFTVDGREVGLYFVNLGDFFGELAVTDCKAHPEFMIAVAKAKVAVMPLLSARDLIASEPLVANAILARLAERLRSVAAHRTLLFLPSPAQRVCAQLSLLIERNMQGNSVIPHAPTHQELAIMINTSRETVTRVFQILQAKDVLRRDGHQFIVTDNDYLLSIAEGKTELPKVA